MGLRTAGGWIGNRSMTGALKQYANEIRNDLRYGIMRWRRRNSLPVLTEDDSEIVRDLIETGVHVTTLETLCDTGGEAILAAGDALQVRLAGMPIKENSFSISADHRDLSDFPHLVGWGLNERILSVVEAYIGLPVAYQGLTVRRDSVGGPQSETRMWHRDNEDNRIVKIIVYLNDVNADGGPFEYIPCKKSPASWRIPVVSSSRVTDDEMERLVPNDHHRSCTGSRGTAVIVDTCRVFHKGAIASAQDRQTLFYCYNSQSPMSPQWCGPLFDHDSFLAACPDLTRAQRDAVDLTY
jgi:hypothetical protein